MTEKQVEARLRNEIKALGGMCLKFVSPGCSGVPDRIILLPGGAVAFAELKAPGMKERPLQQYVQGRIARLGFKVFPSVDGPERIAEVVQWATREVKKATRRNGGRSG